MELTDLIRGLREAKNIPFSSPLDSFTLIKHLVDIRHGTVLDSPEDFGQFYNIAPWDVEVLFSRQIQTVEELAQILEGLN